MGKLNVIIVDATGNKIRYNIFRKFKKVGAKV